MGNRYLAYASMLRAGRHRCFERRRQFDDVYAIRFNRTKNNRDEKEAGRTIRFGDSDPRASSPVQRGVAVREDKRGSAACADRCARRERLRFRTAPTNQWWRGAAVAKASTELCIGLHNSVAHGSTRVRGVPEGKSRWLVM